MKNPHSYFMIFFVALILVISGCGEDGNPVAGDNNGEHTRAYGLKISSSGVTVVNYFKDQPVQGGLNATVGDTTAHFEIEFFDQDSSMFVPNPGTQELRWTIENEANVSVWQHPGEEGGFEFHLIGLQAGLTTIEFQVYHETHPDFVSKEIPVTVQ